jgi:ribose transport system substrate-binding protein
LSICYKQVNAYANNILQGDEIMKKAELFITLVVITVAMVFIAAGCVRKKAEESAQKYTIAVIPKGTSHEFWKSVEAGAKAADIEMPDVEVIWKGPVEENDRSAQIQIVQQFVAKGVSGIVLAPLDDIALLRPVQAAMQKKIPVVIFDSALKGESGKDFVSYVATNNRKGGQMGGEHLAKLLGNKGKVVLLRYQENSASTNDREEGFLEVVEKAGIEVIVKNRYGGVGIDSAKTESLNLLEKLREADGIFCPNESATLGMLLALRQSGIIGKAKFVGFDATPPEVEALRKGEIDALIAQDPYKMGYEGVKTLVAYLKGQKVDAVVDTGVKLITRDNVDSPEVKAILGVK